MKLSQIAIQIVVWVLSWYLFLFISPLCLILWIWDRISGMSAYSNTIRESQDIEDDSESSRWGTSKYVQLQDVSIHYVEAGDKRNPLMLCLHGFPEYWYSWRHQLKEFASTHWVVAVDMRGYGKSEKPSGRSSYHLNLLVEDVRQIITSLGKSKCTLVGHDWGANIGWQVATLYPELISEFIAMNCPHPAAFYDTITKEYSQMLKSWYILFFQLPVIPEILFTQIIGMGFGRRAKHESLLAGEAKAYLDVYKKPSELTGPINYYRNLIFSDSVPRSPVTVPVLLIWGEKDAYLNKSMAALSEKFVENFSLCMIENATHWVQQDAPEIVNKKIRDFVGIPEFTRLRKVSLPQLLATKAYASAVGNIQY